MLRNFGIALAATFVLCVSAQTLWAHPGHPGHGFEQGWQHPWLGWDHLLAMVAVGLLAVRTGHKALWLMPSTFMTAMLGGSLLVAIGVPGGAFVEYGIAVSVLMLGLLMVVSRPVSLLPGMAMVAIAGVFHGHAHAAEMASGGSLEVYAAGFLLATAALHTFGIAAGMALTRTADAKALRYVGAGIMAASAVALAIV